MTDARTLSLALTLALLACLLAGALMPDAPVSRSDVVRNRALPHTWR